MNQKIRQKMRKKPPGLFFLNLTPMIDMFTILLLFLLKSYSVAEFKVNPPKDVNLPASISELDPEIALSISVSKSYIYLEGKKIATIENFRLKKDDLKGLVILPLLNKLNYYTKIAKLKQQSRADFSFKSTIILQADKDLPFHIIKRIMFTSEAANYHLFKFAVLKKAA